MKKIFLPIVCLFFAFAAYAQQDPNPYNDIGYVDVEWILPYALMKEEKILNEGMRLATTWSTTKWVTEEPIPLYSEFTVDGKRYVFSDRMPKLLGEVTNDYVQKTAEGIVKEINLNGCYSHVVVNWVQPGGCRTPFYKEVNGIYEPLTCEDQGLTSHTTDKKAYYVISFQYCPEGILDKKIESNLHNAANNLALNNLK